MTFTLVPFNLYLGSVGRLDATVAVADPVGLAHDPARRDVSFGLVINMGLGGLEKKIL